MWFADALAHDIGAPLPAKSTPDGEKQAYTTAPGRLRDSERLRTPEPGQKIAATAITTAGSRMKTPTT